MRNHLIVAVGITTALLQAVPGEAQDTRKRSLSFGIVGLARGETARLNVVDLEPPDPDLEPPDPDKQCRIAVVFLNREGTPFVDASGNTVARAGTLPTGEAVQLDLTTGDAFGDSRRTRVPFRARVQWLEPPDPDVPDPCVGVVATLEVFDNLTGRTSVVYALPAVGLEPPDPDSAPLRQ